jgi:hypothetical protein
LVAWRRLARTTGAIVMWTGKCENVGGVADAIISHHRDHPQRDLAIGAALLAAGERSRNVLGYSGFGTLRRPGDQARRERVLRRALRPCGVRSASSERGASLDGCVCVSVTSTCPPRRAAATNAAEQTDPHRAADLHYSNLPGRPALPVLSLAGKELEPNNPWPTSPKRNRRSRFVSRSNAPGRMTSP